ncbi:MAG: DHH family phosphoesterase [Alphaproteobacteria bacterium]|nr:DHH family phosphoesterase [Alphaproteobacteria bacterium]
MMKKIELLIEKIKNAKSIAISGHKNLDGDALCSTLALKKIIELNFGKKPVVLYDGNIPKYLDNVPLRESVCFHAHVPEKTKYDLYIVVDYGTRKHLGGVEKFVNSADFVIECDHHHNDDLVGNLCFDDTEKAAAAQIIYDIARKAKFEIDDDIRNLLAIGIITDTGNFKFVHNSDVLLDMASLVDAGVNIASLVNLLNNRDKKTVLVESKAASEAEFLMKGRLAIATINRKDYKKLDGRGELVLGILGEIHGVEYVVLLKEQREYQVGISFRSRHKPINQIAESFGGGGHLYAAGAVVQDSLENVHERVINAFKGV